MDILGNLGSWKYVIRHLHHDYEAFCTWFIYLNIHTVIQSEYYISSTIITLLISRLSVLLSEIMYNTILHLLCEPKFKHLPDHRSCIMKKSVSRVLQPVTIQVSLFACSVGMGPSMSTLLVYCHYNLQTDLSLSWSCMVRHFFPQCSSNNARKDSKHSQSHYMLQ